VGYESLCVSAPAAAAGFPAIERTDLAFEEAVRLVVADNPELKSLRTEAAGVNLNPGPQPLEFMTEIEGGNLHETVIGTDVLSLLGLGPRRAERALARAQASEKLLVHHERARALVARLAAAYAVDAALARLPSPRPDLDVKAFEDAGLASGAALAASKSVLAEAEAEAEVIATMVRDARREIAALVGADPASDIVPLAPGPDWPPVPPAHARGLLYARGDLLREFGAYHVADQELRVAVARQWPTLGVYLGANVDVEEPMQMVRVMLPWGAPREARAMACAREAARQRFEARVLDALHDAAARRNDLAAAEAKARGAAARRTAAASLVDAAKARVEAEAEDAFADVVEASMEVVRASIEDRMAAMEVARLRVAAAEAAGWPSAFEAGVSR
jgi:hypothetical protein